MESNFNVPSGSFASKPVRQKPALAQNNEGFSLGIKGEKIKPIWSNPLTPAHNWLSRNQTWFNMRYLKSKSTLLILKSQASFTLRGTKGGRGTVSDFYQWITANVAYLTSYRKKDKTVELAPSGQRDGSCPEYGRVTRTPLTSIKTGFFQTHQNKSALKGFN